MDAARHFRNLIQKTDIVELIAFHTTYIVSLQEMNVAVTQRYLDFLRRNLRSGDTS